MRTVVLLTKTILLSFIAASASAANWPQWRGPDSNGSTTEKGLPLVWNQTNGILWKTPLPGYAGSTPVVWGDSVFLTSPDPDRNLLLIHIDADTGRELWRRKVGGPDKEKGRNNMASPSPVTDGKRVLAMFGTGHIAAFDFSGKQLWARNLATDYGAFAHMWLYGASPLLLDGRLYIPVLQQNPVPSDYSHALVGGSSRESFLLCLDAATGTNIWRQVRTTPAHGESMEAYTTPIPWKAPNGNTEILLFGANHITAHDPLIGVELWRSPDLNPQKDTHWRVVPSPVSVGSVVVVCGPRGNPVFAIRPQGRGLLPRSSGLWTYKEQPSDCCTPLVCDGKLFILNGDRQVLTRLDPETGKVIWKGQLGVREIFRASPTGADGKIYCISEAGTVVILDSGEEFKIIATNRMGEPPVRSSVVAAHDRLYIRTAKHLFCVGRKGG